MPEETSQHLANFQAEIHAGFPYVFIRPERFEKIKHLRAQGKWTDIKAIRNNLNRDFEVIRKRSGIARCTLHDLRRSAVTNWAQALPIQAVQQFAGHSNITTTRKYYLFVRQEDIEKAGTFLNRLLAESKA
jgi:integrase